MKWGSIGAAVLFGLIFVVALRTLRRRANAQPVLVPPKRWTTKRRKTNSTFRPGRPSLRRRTEDDDFDDAFGPLRGATARRRASQPGRCAMALRAHCGSVEGSALFLKEVFHAGFVKENGLVLVLPVTPSHGPFASSWLRPAQPSIWGIKSDS